MGLAYSAAGHSFDEIISRRYNTMRCTLTTTNYLPQASTGAPPPNHGQDNPTPQSLGDRVGARVYSRLTQMCAFVEVGGVDYRSIKA